MSDALYNTKEKEMINENEIIRLRLAHAFGGTGVGWAI
jgi:hypothetical protein